jgi:hypothetical protein
VNSMIEDEYTCQVIEGYRELDSIGNGGVRRREIVLDGEDETMRSTADCKGQVPRTDYDSRICYPVLISQEIWGVETREATQVDTVEH